MTQEQENFYRHSTVIVDETKQVFLHLIEFHLINERITLHIFIEKNGHEIYHLCYNIYPCCQCQPGTRATRGSTVLHPPQLDILFDKTGTKLPVHNHRSRAPPHCCCHVNPNLQLHDLDFTLARFLLVNFTKLVPQGSPERIALDFLASSRNHSFAHAKEGKISNSEYQRSIGDIEKQLLVLAKVCGKEAETKQRLSDVAKQPLNANICLQLQNALLQQCKIDEKLNILLAEKTLPDCLTKDIFNVTVTEGSDAHFEIWTKEDDLSTIWSKDRSKILNSKKYIIKKSGIIHSLVVLNTDLCDKGLYTVRVNDIERQACLYIEEYFTKNLRSLESIEGETVHFLCEVIENSFPACWSKKGFKLENGGKYEMRQVGKNHRLFITNCDLDDAGDYTVNINNRVRTTSLSVTEYFIQNMEKTTKCLEGENVELSCTVLENDALSVWEKDGVVLQHSEKYKIKDEGKRHTLLILCSDLQDGGNYTVKVNNRTRLTSLQVQEYFTKNPRNLECIEGERVEFSCEVADDSFTACWCKNGVKLGNDEKYDMHQVGKNHRFCITNCDLDDAGIYTVNINNRIRTTSLCVIEYFSQNMEKNIDCIKGGNIELTCFVLEDNVQAIWERNGIVVQQSARYKIEDEGMMHKLSIIQVDQQDAGNYTVMINNRVRSATLKVIEIPAAMHQLSEQDKRLYLEIIKSETETRYYIRIIIIGENGVGKTCLLHRLLGETIEGIESTDGVDIVNRCKIRLSDGCWVFDEVSDKRKAILSRIRRAINSKISEDANSYEILYSRIDQSNTNESERIHEKLHFQNRIHKPSEDVLIQETPFTHKPIDTESNQNNLTQWKESKQIMMEQYTEEVVRPHSNDERDGVIDMVEVSFSLEDIKIPYTSSQLNPAQVTESQISMKREKVFTETVLNGLSEFVNDIGKVDNLDEVLVDCAFWDFAGQRHYYPTHPIFLNPNAVHLLVADIEKDIKQINIEDGFDSIGEYVDFWFDSVHSCRDVEIEIGNNRKYLNPPVIHVFTGIDKCKDNLDQRKIQIRQQLMSMLHGEEKLRHLRDMCFVSNTQSSDEDFDYLRRSIFTFGMELKTFGEKLPLKWIRLERSLDIIREAGMNILSWIDLTDVASECSIDDENEIKVFLKYQHKVGTITYFDCLKDHIILNQTWLAAAFRCLVSHKIDTSIRISPEWKILEDTGKLEPVLIEKLFQKEPQLEFNKHQGHILNVMELFGIIFKPSTLLDDGQKESSSTYYIPCMISKTASVEEIYKVFSVKNDKCTCTPWLCIEFKFMPLDFFNHILCYYIKEYPICTEPSTRRVAVYHGMGVFYLDKTKLRKFVLCFSKNTIAIQLWQWKKVEQGKYREMMEELMEVIQMVIEKFETRSVSYLIKLKCSDGLIHNPSGRFTYNELVELGNEYFCEDNSVCHNTTEFFQTWFKHYSQILELQQELRNLGMETANKFQDILKEGICKCFWNRICLVGPYSVGKSTLARILIGESIPPECESADRIQIYMGKAGMEVEQQKWKIIPKGTAVKGILAGLLLSVTNKDPQNRTRGNATFPTKATPHSETVGTNENEKLKDSSVFQQSEMSPTGSDQIENSKNGQLMYQSVMSPIDMSQTKQSSYTSLTDISADECIPLLSYDDDKILEKMSVIKNTHTRMSITKIYRLLIQEIRDRRHKQRFIPIDIWDFSGKKDYYMTHQLFITSRGIYVLMFNGSVDIHQPGHFGRPTVAVYLLQRVNSILTWCERTDAGFPRIIFVATHKDKIAQSKIEFQRTQLMNSIHELFRTHAGCKHLEFKPLIFINAKDRNDVEIDIMRRRLIERAVQHPRWGEEMPTAWVPLELQLAEKFEEGTNIISRADLEMLNSQNEQMALNQKQLNTFLTVLHSYGKLLYFDEAKLRDFIIINPAYMEEVIDSIVTEKQFWPKSILKQTQKTGKIRREDIYLIWSQKQFQHILLHKEHMVEMLTRLDILIALRTTSTTTPTDKVNRDFLVPCMITEQNSTDYIEKSFIPTKTIILAYTFIEQIIPPALYYRFLATFITMWEVMIYKGRSMLFSDLAVVAINESHAVLVQMQEYRLVVSMVHSNKREYIVPILASSIQECLTASVQRISKFYATLSCEGEKDKHLKTGHTTMPFKIEFGVLCNKGIFKNTWCMCFFSQRELTQSLWKCPVHNRKHDIQSLYLWFSEKISLERCVDTCTGLGILECDQAPSDKHLCRLARMLGVYICRKLVIHLGLTINVLEQLEYQFQCRNAVDMMFTALIKWKRTQREPTFSMLQKALEDCEEDVHKLCQVFRDIIPDTYGLTEETLSKKPTYKSLQSLLDHIGDNVMELGVELGLDFSEIEMIQYEYKNKLKDQARAILKRWMEQSRERPTVRTLVKALHRIGRQSCIQQVQF